MSSSISADYSPTSDYSYPSDLSISSSSPNRQPQPQIRHALPPRLSSPHIFRDIFTNEGAGPTARFPPRLPPLHEINFAETMQDVNRALQSANRAIQTAQEAFQSRRISFPNTNRRQDVVDLTNSPPSPSPEDHSYDAFLTRTLHPHDSQHNNHMGNRSLNEPYYPRINVATNSQSLFVEEDDPTSTYAGQSDSLAGARRRFQAQSMNNRRTFMGIPNMERTLVRSGISAAQAQEEEEAIRRQRVAREQWEHTQARQRQRERLQQQRDRIMARTQQTSPDTLRTQGQPPLVYAASAVARPSSSGTSFRPPSSSTQASSSSVHAVDLTSVNDTTDLAAVLLHSQSKNKIADPASSSIQARSALTAYKCPICLEPPRNATSTICGHLFCYECILETLKHSENMRREDAAPHRKVKGQCPVCRKELARKDEEGLSRTLVPLELKLISRKKMEELRQQERKRQLDMEEQSKGKGKERADTDPNKGIFEVNSDDEDDWGVSGSSQKENKAKRVKLSASEELDQELFGAFMNDEQAA